MYTGVRCGRATRVSIRQGLLLIRALALGPKTCMTPRARHGPEDVVTRIQSTSTMVGMHDECGGWKLGHVPTGVWAYSCAASHAATQPCQQKGNHCFGHGAKPRHIPLLHHGQLASSWDDMTSVSCVAARKVSSTVGSIHAATVGLLRSRTFTTWRPNPVPAL